MIEVRGLTKRYGATLAVDDLSFDVEPGTVTGFPRAERGGRVHDHADDARPRPAHRLVAFVFAAGTALVVGLGFLLRNTAGALVPVFLLMLLLPVLLPQFGYEWMPALASILPGSGAAYLLLGEVPGRTEASSVTALLVWAGAALLLGWVGLIRNDANR